MYPKRACLQKVDSSADIAYVRIHFTIVLYHNDSKDCGGTVGVFYKFGVGAILSIVTAPNL